MRQFLLITALASAACGSSHTGGGDASSGPDGSTRVDSGPSGGCGMEPAAMECRTLCDDACGALSTCGLGLEECLAGCYRAYACPGETPGMDAAICGGGAGLSRLSCDQRCAWADTWGGYGLGPGCAPTTTTSCEGRSFCDCTGECEPIVDTSTGCICRCDDPFNCGGDTCACVCGGATYLGCRPAPGTCTEAPGMGSCCFGDEHCPAGQQCHAIPMCVVGRGGVCKPPGLPTACWSSRDCGEGVASVCVGVSICPCDADCDAEDMPGNCE